MTLAFGVLALAAMPMLIWLSVGRDVLRVGYVPITKKPSLDTEGKTPASSSTIRHDGVLHLVIADHVDPGLVLVVLRLDGGGQWISTVRTDEQGFGVVRLASWRARAERMAIFEKPGAREVVFRPITMRSARSAAPEVRPMPTKWDRPLGARYVAWRGPITIAS